MIPRCFYRVSVKALVRDDQGRILLAKESDGVWDLLGGGLDYGEDAVAALRREVNEEAGLTVTSISPAPSYFVTCKHPSADTYIANIVYDVTLTNIDFTPSDECVELAYFTPAQAAEMNILPNVRELLKQL
jgi:8-oxo-dGTP diphosphatase